MTLRLTIGARYRIDGLPVPGRGVDTANLAWSYQGHTESWDIWDGPTGTAFTRRGELERVGRQHLAVTQ